MTPGFGGVVLEAGPLMGKQAGVLDSFSTSRLVSVYKTFVCAVADMCFTVFPSRYREIGGKEARHLPTRGAHRNVYTQQGRIRKSIRDSRRPSIQSSAGLIPPYEHRFLLIAKLYQALVKQPHVTPINKFSIYRRSLHVCPCTNPLTFGISNINQLHIIPV